MRKFLPNALKPLSNSHGQGVIEYLLVLIVTVAIILGIIYQFNDAFRVYAKSYFGDYLACLLETGELPSIGGEANGICNALFQNFSIANGRPHASGDGSSSGGGSGSKGGGSAKPTKASESQSAGGSAYIAQNSGSSGSRFNSRSSSSSSGGSADSTRNRKNYTGSSGVSIPPSALGGRSSGASGSDQYLDGSLYVERRKTEEREETNKIALKASSTSVKDLQRMRVNRQMASLKQDEPDSEFTIGNFLRILLIIAIIVALIVFLGGQALQISKSMD